MDLQSLTNSIALANNTSLSMHGNSLKNVIDNVNRTAPLNSTLGINQLHHQMQPMNPNMMNMMNMNLQMNNQPVLPQAQPQYESSNDRKTGKRQYQCKNCGGYGHFSKTCQLAPASQVGQQPHQQMHQSQAPTLSNIVQQSSMPSIYNSQLPPMSMGIHLPLSISMLGLPQQQAHNSMIPAFNEPKRTKTDAHTDEHYVQMQGRHALRVQHAKDGAKCSVCADGFRTDPHSVISKQLNGLCFYCESCNVSICIPTESKNSCWGKHHG